MIYPQRDNLRRRRKIRTTVGIVGFVFVFIIALNIWKPNLLSPAVQAIGKPILEAQGGFLGSIGNTWRFLHSKAALVQENNDLKNKIALFNAVVTERDYYKYQNSEIAKIVNRIKSDKQKTFAQIISKPGFSPYDTIIIDAGLDQGLQEGDKVFASDDIILGQIADAYAHTSTVVLYSTAEKETPVLIGSTTIQAVAFGKGGGNFEIKLPRNTGVTVGDSVVMASTTDKIFGTIQYMNTSATDSFERALFKSPVDISSLSFVSIQKQ